MRSSAPLTPEPFRAVGMWYEDFTQTEDDEVSELLARAEAGSNPDSSNAPGPGRARFPAPPPPSHRQEDPS